MRTVMNSHLWQGFETLAMHDMLLSHRQTHILEFQRVLCRTCIESSKDLQAILKV